MSIRRRNAFTSNLTFLWTLCVFSMGTASGGVISFTADPGGALLSNPTLRDATGADLVGMAVFYEAETAPGSNVYPGLEGFWSATGAASGGIFTSAVVLTLSGDSHTNAFHLANIGLTPLAGVVLNTTYDPPFLLAQNIAFNGTTITGPGSTSDSQDGSAIYAEEAVNGTTPYYFEFLVIFDGEGLAPGATATFLAPLDVIVPEPSTGFLLIGLTAVSLCWRYRQLSPRQGMKKSSGR